MITILLAASLFLQDPPPSGPLVDRPIIVTGDGVLTDSEFYRIPEGPGDVAPTFFSSAAPRFAFLELFGGVGVELGSFSSGGASIVSDKDGCANWDTEAEDLQWGFLTFSVTQDTIGGPESPYGDEKGGSTSSNLGADVFTFFLPGSENAGIPPEEVGVVRKSREGAEIGMAEVRGLDQLLNNLTLDSEISDGVDEFATHLYFTVAPGSLQAASSAGWFDGQPASSATILWTTWNGLWTLPEPFRTHLALDLDEGDVITALAVDALGGKLLFATASAERDEKLQVAIGGYVGPYKLGGDSCLPVAAALGITGGNNDVIDAICSNDPNVEAPLTLVADKTIGIPKKVAGDDPGLHIAACRRENPVVAVGNPTDEILVYLRGSPNYSGGRGTSTAFLWAIIPGSRTLLWVCQYSNNPRSVARHIVSVPDTLSGEVSFQWTLMDNSGPRWISTHETRITYR